MNEMNLYIVRILCQDAQFWRKFITAFFSSSDQFGVAYVNHDIIQ